MAFIISVLRRCLWVAYEGTGRPRLIGGSLAACTLIAAVCVVVGAGCSTTSMGEAPVAPGDSAPSAVVADKVVAVATPEDLERLDNLWKERSNQTSIDKDYPIGPGDILSISVPQVAELEAKKVRVSAQGTIELPLVGIVQAGGVTEAGLAKELNMKLEKFMYNPQAAVFVEEYRNRQVAVIGAVSRPGLVVLNSPSETILDVITRVGGLESAAADEIILIPAEQAGTGTAQRLAAVAYRPPNAVDGAGDDPSGTVGARDNATEDTRSASNQSHSPGEPSDPERLRHSATTDSSQEALAMLPTNARPISIPVKSKSLTGAGRYLNLPVRPGDVIVVPGGGDVMVVGWVERPGYFKVGSGLTVMGAIGAAGGPMYAADTTDVTLIRSTPNGSKRVVPLNLKNISEGKESDIPVKGNDVIDVPYSSLRIGPYVFYSVISRMGLGGPAIPAF
jgi:protein involved in polysaccharide export with SLBB domain